MLAIVQSVALTGMEGCLVRVEVDVSKGLPAFSIVGLPDSAVREAVERVRAAIKNSGFEFPVKRITVNLAPADIRKEGPSFDLAIALGILIASGQIDTSKLKGHIYLGELSLDGSIKYVHGVLPSVLVARDMGIPNVVLPTANIREGALVKDVYIYPLTNLAEAADFMAGRRETIPYQNDLDLLYENYESSIKDLCDIKGQRIAKRALEIAAAGGHNMLMIGPPGAGKTMLANCLNAIMPPLDWEEAIEVTKIYSIAGLLKAENPLILKRPFRSPHHNATRQSLIGGGKIPRPGEISLSNNGVLFLDELPEFSKDALEALRQPLEDRAITVTRTQAAYTYPARIILLAAMNPCPCGYYGSNVKECQCSPVQIKRYLHRISGPLLDRIDLHVEVPALKYNELTGKGQTETTIQVRERVLAAREIQKKRYKGILNYNAEMSPRQIREFCHLDKKTAQVLKDAFVALGLTARGHYKILKIARTIADLNTCPQIKEEHIAEAIQYRNLDRKFWA